LLKNNKIKLAKLQNIRARPSCETPPYSYAHNIVRHRFFIIKKVSPLVAEFGDPGLS